MLRLPAPGTAARELFTPADLVDPRKLPTFREALRNAVTFMKAEKGVRAVHTLTMRANGEIWLMRVGPRGGWTCLWNFGDPFK